MKNEKKLQPEHELLLADLTKNIGAAKSASLMRVKEACDSLDRKLAPITLQAIEGEIVAKHGKVGPRAQSIANDKEVLRPYSLARQRHSEILRGGINAREAKSDSVKTILASITDPDTKTSVLELEDRCRAAERALSRAKVLLSEAVPGIDPEALISGKSAPVHSIDASPEHIAALREVVRVLNDEKALSAVGLCRDPSGRIKRKGGTGDTLLTPSVIAGLTELERGLRGEGRSLLPPA